MKKECVGRSTANALAQKNAEERALQKWWEKVCHSGGRPGSKAPEVQPVKPWGSESISSTHNNRGGT